jgi:uncharacterized membrane protein
VTIRGPFAVVLLVLLFASVAANLVVAGFTLGRFAGPRPGADIDRILALGMRGFPPEIQRGIAERVHAERDTLRDRIRAIQDARRKAFDAMRADPFDRGALSSAFADVRTETGAVQAFGQEIVTDAVAAAPPDVRKLIRPPRGGPGGGP